MADEQNEPNSKSQRLDYISTNSDNSLTESQLIDKIWNACSYNKHDDSITSSVTPSYPYDNYKEHELIYISQNKYSQDSNYKDSNYKSGCSSQQSSQAYSQEKSENITSFYGPSQGFSYTPSQTSTQEENAYILEAYDDYFKKNK
jgi:hypothetical protein